MKRVHSFMLAVSGVTAVACAILLPLSIALDPREHHVSFSDDIHIGISRGRIDLFNHADYGPYRGSLIFLSDGEGGVIPPLEREFAFGDLLGIYVRYFRWADPPDRVNILWTVSVSLWWPLATAGVAALVCWYSKRRSVAALQTERGARPDGGAESVG